MSKNSISGLDKTGCMQVEPEGVERVEELLAWSSQLTDTPLTQQAASQIPR
jgi:primosomal replication protein N